MNKKDWLLLVFSLCFIPMGTIVGAIKWFFFSFPWDLFGKIVMVLLILLCILIYLGEKESSRRKALKEEGEEGEEEEEKEELSENDILKKRIEESAMPAEAKEEAKIQLQRLERMPEVISEASSIKDHLDWLLDMPWNVFVNHEKIDLKQAKTILDEEHFGLALVKNKILDYLAVQCFKSRYNVQILCLDGPPGVGKTSIGSSIAKALGKKFVHIPLGGVRDESEIRGSRRVYIGSAPGRIIQSLRDAKSSNPVFMLDEIDKISSQGSSGWGNPAAVLLEVLDPKQNTSFYDHYLGVGFDISNVTFIATSNDCSRIPGPLRDRMDIIHLSGYTLCEKLKIATVHLWPKLIINMGLLDKGITIDENCILEVIESCTNECGVRELERRLATLCSKFARFLVEDNTAITFTRENISDYLGERLYGKPAVTSTILKSNRQQESL